MIVSEGEWEKFLHSYAWGSKSFASPYSGRFVSFRFAAAVSLFGRRRLGGAWVSLGGTSGVSVVVGKRYGL